MTPPSNRERLQALFSPADLGLADTWTRDDQVDAALSVAVEGRPAATPEQWFNHARAQLLEQSIRQVLRGKTSITVPGEVAVTWDRKSQLQELRRELRTAYLLAGLPVPNGGWNTPSTSIPVIATFGGR